MYDRLGGHGLVTDRSDFIPGNLGFRSASYTCRYGFVDWGHASPGEPSSITSIAGLHRQLIRQTGLQPGTESLDIRLNGRPAFLVTYGMSMRRRVFGMPVNVATTRHWVVLRDLSHRQYEEVALGILRQASVQFEGLQESMGLSSGFSAEDQPSNVLGLLGHFRGLSLPALRRLVGEVSVEESLAVWDRHLSDGGLGARKNRGFAPILFPNDACRGSDTSLPDMIRNARYAPSGGRWVAVVPRYVDGRLVSARLPLDVDSVGNVRVRRR